MCSQVQYLTVQITLCPNIDVRSHGVFICNPINCFCKKATVASFVKFNLATPVWHQLILKNILGLRVIRLSMNLQMDTCQYKIEMWGIKYVYYSKNILVHFFFFQMSKRQLWSYSSIKVDLKIGLKRSVMCFKMYLCLSSL